MVSLQPFAARAVALAVVTPRRGCLKIAQHFSAGIGVGRRDSPVSMKGVFDVKHCFAFSVVTFRRQPPFRGGLKPRGLGASSPQGNGDGAPVPSSSVHRQTAFHVSIRPRARGTAPMMSHPSGGSRRDSALLSEAIPTQANGTSACDARCSLGNPRPSFTVLRVG